MTELPRGWAIAPIMNIGRVITGATPSTKDPANWGGEVPFVTPGDMQHMGVTTTTARTVTDQGVPPGRLLPPESVLVTCIGNLGRTTLNSEASVSNQQINAIIPTHPAMNRFVAYACCAPRFQRQLASVSTSTTVALVNKRNFERLVVPVAPLAEQARIVAAIEEQFSRLDAGVGAVERAVLNLKRMRGAVLQATITGTLVSGDGDAQGVTALLDELLESRREASGKSQRRYVQPVEPLPSRTALPSRWAWASLDMLSESAGAITDGPFGSNLKSAHYTPGGPRVIRLQNIGDGDFLDAEAHISEEHFQSLSKHAVRPGDLICALLGETTPRAAIVPDDLGPAIVKADCPRVRLSPLVNHRFVWAVLNAPSTRREASARIHGVGRPRLNLKEVREIPIPLPPRAEQDLLVDAMDRQLEAIHRLEADLATRRDMAEALRSSILAAAFSGTLAQQNPSDEPALVLLQRIAAERTSPKDGYRVSPRERRRKATA